MSLALQPVLSNGYQPRCQAVLRNKKDGTLYQCVRGKSDASVDPHPFCTFCRKKAKGGEDCSPQNTCSVCVNWPVWQWDLFLGKKTYKERSAASKRRQE